MYESVVLVQSNSRLTLCVEDNYFVRIIKLRKRNETCKFCKRKLRYGNTVLKFCCKPIFIRSIPYIEYICDRCFRHEN